MEVVGRIGAGVGKWVTMFVGVDGRVEGANEYVCFPSDIVIQVDLGCRLCCYFCLLMV